MVFGLSYRGYVVLSVCLYIVLIGLAGVYTWAISLQDDLIAQRDQEIAQLLSLSSQTVAAPLSAPAAAALDVCDYDTMLQIVETGDEVAQLSALDFFYYSALGGIGALGDAASKPASATSQRAGMYLADVRSVVNALTGLPSP
ncbi:MAG: hypothetical protein SF123_19555 [Chloroflexota bacterium]|nr:hypothetical protein [Chloroflexota bacterium]